MEHTQLSGFAFTLDTISAPLPHQQRFVHSSPSSSGKVFVSYRNRPRTARTLGYHFLTLNDEAVEDCLHSVGAALIIYLSYESKASFHYFSKDLKISAAYWACPWWCFFGYCDWNLGYLGRFTALISDSFILKWASNHNPAPTRILRICPFAVALPQAPLSPC